MKKLLFFLCLILFFSCEKQPENCWRCPIVYKPGEHPSTMTSTELKCGYDEESILAYQQAHGFTCTKQN